MTRQAVAAAAVPGIVLGIVLLAALVVPAGPAVAVVVGAVAALAVSVAVWRRAPQALLRALGATTMTWADAPRAFVVAEGLCATMGLAVPTLARVEAAEADALVVGTTPGSVTVVVTSRLLEELGPVEMEAVLAHELCHVKAGEVALPTVVAALALPLGRWVDVGGIVRAVSGRGRELETDQRAVAVTRYPPGLRAALTVLADTVDEAAAGVASAAGDRSVLARQAVGRCTRWLWTVALGPAPTGAAVIGDLDVASVRIAALDEL
jgi:heat shock protein HtpX